MTATAAGFRTLFRSVPQDVWIVTTRDADGSPVGTTVSSLTSVSSDPPTVAFSLRESASVLPQFLAAEQVLVHAMSTEGVEAARTCAEHGADRFAQVEWQTGLGGLPQVDGVYGCLLTRVARTIPVAGSALFICPVQATWIPGSAGPPALYLDRSFDWEIAKLTPSATEGL